MGVLEELGYGEDVEAGVHHDEEEGSCLEEAWQERVVFHDVVQQYHHFLHERRVKGQQELHHVRYGISFGEHTLGSWEGPDDSIVAIPAKIEELIRDGLEQKGGEWLEQTGEGLVQIREGLALIEEML